MKASKEALSTEYQHQFAAIAELRNNYEKLSANSLAAWSEHAVEIGQTVVKHLVLYESELELPDLKAHRISNYLALSNYENLLLPQRACALALALSFEEAPRILGELIFADASAAWIYSGGKPPPQITTCSGSRLYTRHRGHHRNLQLKDNEIQVLGGIPVMSVDRCYRELSRINQRWAEQRIFARRLVLNAWVNP